VVFVSLPLEPIDPHFKFVKLSAHAGPHLTPFLKLVVVKNRLFEYIKVGLKRT